MQNLKPWSCEPVWPSGKALGTMVSGRTSVRYRFGTPFSSKRLWFVDTVLWLCLSLPTETLKWLSSLPILMQESFWWWQCSDRYIISLSPHLHTPFPHFSPSLVSRTVSVDVKHHVYLTLKPFLFFFLALPFYSSFSHWHVKEFSSKHIALKVDVLGPESLTS